MNYCIDGLAAAKMQGTDLFSYSREIISLLNSSTKFDEMNVIWDSFPLSFYWERLKNMNFVPLSIDRTKNDYSKLVDFIKENDVAIYHSPNNGFSLPSEKVCKYVTTIHTLYPMADKRNIDDKYLNKFLKMVPFALDISDRILVNSEFTRDELINYFKVDETKVKVVHPKCSEIFKPMEKILCKNFLKRNYKIDYPYMLYVGSITERKNLELIIEIFKQVKAKENKIKLIIAGDGSGKRADYLNRIKSLINKYNLDKDVIFLGVVKYTHLPILYSGALCVLDFSNYNSYPLSIVEASKCKAVVICNKTPVNLKVLNKAVVYANNDEIPAIADFIQGMNNNSSYKSQITSKFIAPIHSNDEQLLDMYSF
ncbi:glycosyltransferase family 4 protein [Clostridium manihotivorum]|uniref:Uncharacterized protein n=1 Tax=Clostridium manihotivorum TaxID=2320868 RepID=A0A3R5U7Z9_9CLOT|nr:glycosyltransferase family 1 protein [Clostridium manihotivorum]QAA31297.1 hypothetical protein C1I91_06390 [Clostridium manihotivorum]